MRMCPCGTQGQNPNQIHHDNFQNSEEIRRRGLTTQAKKSRTYMVLIPLIDYTEVNGMYNEKVYTMRSLRPKNTKVIRGE